MKKYTTLAVVVLALLALLLGGCDLPVSIGDPTTDLTTTDGPITVPTTQPGTPLEDPTTEEPTTEEPTTEEPTTEEPTTEEPTTEEPTTEEPTTEEPTTEEPTTEESTTDATPPEVETEDEYTKRY